MAGSIRFDYSNAAPLVTAQAMEAMAAPVADAHRMLHEKSGRGSEFLGWLDLPVAYDQAEYARIKDAAARIRSMADALIVIGIGGSYLGARATIEALGHSFHNQISVAKRKGVEIYFAGQNISPTYLSHLLEMLEGKEIALNVISKSGTTTEPALAFRIFRSILEDRYGPDEATRRIFVTTDKARGAMKKLADAEGYETFVIPDDVGGRYSVLTAVGLLPIAAAGLDTDKLLKGAADAMEAYAVPNLEQNPCYQYAAARNLLYRSGKTVEVLASYEPALVSFAEWWKQLYGESEGKENKGLFPASVNFSTDLHSMGQYLQEGLRNLLETVVVVDTPRRDIKLEHDPADADGFNFLAGHTMNFVNRKAMEGTLLAHTDGGVPNLLVTIPDLSPYAFGEMLYFFEKACGISGYLLGVNPFDQPGVEAYKKNMFALLGKPGFEKKRAQLEERLRR